MSRTDILSIVGRNRPLYEQDLAESKARLDDTVKNGAFLVLGGAGSIGQAVVKQIFRRQPNLLHVVDISENNMVELVRDVRSSLGYTSGEFRTFALDIGSVEYDSLIRDMGRYDYILNLSALKHVRSEKDPYTLMRLIAVNILNTEKTVAHAERMVAKKYFAVSTDKATNPVNMMGASKRIMELMLLNASLRVPVSTARFANVAFSDGSLLHGFALRIAKGQPLSAPWDVRRFFLTDEESGVLCLMSCLLGENRDIFFPKLHEAEDTSTFSDIAVRYLHSLGHEPDICASEDEARAKARSRKPGAPWPCYFFDSDTTGEKPFEEFYVTGDDTDLERFQDIGIIRNKPYMDRLRIDRFIIAIEQLRRNGVWTKADLVGLFCEIVPEFSHLETGKYLDDRM